jgi:hypothetical protein
MNNLAGTEFRSHDEDEVIQLLWQDSELCVVRSVCGVADAMGVTVKPALVRRLLQTYDSKWSNRYQRLQKLGIHSYHFNINHALADVRNLVDQINSETHGNIPHPQIVNTGSWEKALRLTPRGELVIFMDPFPGHDTYHVVHVGFNSSLVENEGIECIQDRYEAMQMPLIEQAFQHKATHVALFPKK